MRHGLAEHIGDSCLPAEQARPRGRASFLAGPTRSFRECLKTLGAGLPRSGPCQHRLRYGRYPWHQSCVEARTTGVPAGPNVVHVNPKRPAPGIFLIERYLPVTRLDDLTAAVRRVEQACAAHRDAGLDLHYLHSTFLPAEDTCFCVFRAPSAESVQA